MVVFGQGDDVPVGGDLEAAAPRDLDVRTVELGDVLPEAVVDGHVELVAVGVADEDVALVGDVDAVGEAGNLLVPNAANKTTLFIDDNNAVALLKGKEY